MKTIKIDEQVYKIGLHGKVFVQRGSEWLRSLNYTAGEVKHAIEVDEAKRGTL